MIMDRRKFFKNALIASIATPPAINMALRSQTVREEAFVRLTDIQTENSPFSALQFPPLSETGPMLFRKVQAKYDERDNVQDNVRNDSYQNRNIEIYFMGLFHLDAFGIRHRQILNRLLQETESSVLCTEYPIYEKTRIPLGREIGPDYFRN